MLSKVTKTDIKMPPGFTLGNMLAYELHVFVEEVEEVVETSEKVKNCHLLLPRDGSHVFSFF